MAKKQNLGKFTVTPKALKELIIPVLKAGLCPMVTSSPGIGKSSVATEICDDMALEMIDYRLSTVDPTDLTGFLVPNQEKGRADYLPPSIFPLEGKDELPTGKKGWLLFLDEITAAPPAIQAAAYKLILDRRVGEHKLHERVVIMAAGNGVGDNAVASRMSTALQSRMIHFSLAPSSKEWIEWAIAKKLDSRVIAYIEHAPDALNRFDPSHSDKTFSCSRTVEFLSKVIQKLPAGANAHDYKWSPLYAGTIGEGEGTQFRAFLEIYKDLVKFDHIVANPETCPIPQEPSALFALTGVIGERVNVSNIDEVIKYVDRLPVEHQVSSIRKIIANSPDLKGHQVFIDWLDTNSKKLF